MAVFFYRYPEHFFIPSVFSFSRHPRVLYFFLVIPGPCFFIVIPGLRPGDPYFKAQSPSQTPPEQRDPQGTLLSTCRAPAVQVIPWLAPGIQVNNKANLLTWIAGSSPAMTVSCTISRPAQLGALCEWLRFWSKNRKKHLSSLS